MFLVLLTLIPFTSFSQQGWFWQNPLPQGNDLKDVWVLNENTIFAVGDRGTLLRSTNAGVDWEITHKLSGISEDIVDIQFITGQKGWLLANKYLADDGGKMLYASSKILLTIDGGINWNVIAAFDSISLNDLFFINENIGWVVGYSGDTGSLDHTLTGMIFKTLDGGNYWDTLFVQSVIGQPYQDEKPLSYSSIQFINPDTAWIAGKSFICSGTPTYGELLRTTDGGVNWTTVNDSMSSIIDFQFLNSNVGWLIEYWQCYLVGYSVKKTTNSGLSWEVVFNSSSGSSLPIPTLYFINETLGWVSEPAAYGSLSNGDFIHKTTDGGITWSTDTVQCPFYGSMHFSDEINGCIVGKYGEILYTGDGGWSWIQRSRLVINEDLTSINFCDEDIGWVVSIAGSNYPYGVYGKILKTTDGGSSWIEQLPSGPWNFFWLSSIQAVSDQVVYAAGAEIYKTTNGGNLWSKLNPIGDWHFNTLFFLDENTGFIGNQQGDNPFYYPGKIYKTTNGGNSWNNVFTASNSIQSIFFINNSEGWAVGYENPIYKTTDGGNTWQDITSNNQCLESVFFIDSNIGWAVGYSQSGMTREGVIIKSLDGGYNWNIVYISQEHLFNSVFFNDSLNGYVVGYEGVILSTTDGGISWINQFDNTPKGLYDIFFINDNTGWVVGEDGIILKTTTGGVTFVEEEKTDETPREFFLSQNYPNPFNPITKISWQSPINSWQTLKIYDVLGNIVATLVNEYRPAGNYKVDFNAFNLPSGVYFYQLRVDPSPSSQKGQAGQVFVETKKFLFLK